LQHIKEVANDNGSFGSFIDGVRAWRRVHIQPDGKEGFVMRVFRSEAQATLALVLLLLVAISFLAGCATI